MGKGKRRAKRMIGQHVSDTYSDGKRTMRKCTTCGDIKSLYDCYHRNGVDDNGDASYRLECKVCYNAKRRENRVSNKHAQFIGHQKNRGESDINYTFTQWRETVIFFGGCCAYCGRSMRKGETLTRDHLEALSNGGKTEQSNIIPACASCNSSKKDRDFKDWFMSQTFFSQDRLNKIYQWRTIIRVVGGGDDDE